MCVCVCVNAEGFLREDDWVKIAPTNLKFFLEEHRVNVHNLQQCVIHRFLKGEETKRGARSKRATV